MDESLAQRLPFKDEVLSSWLMRRLSQLGLGRAVFDDALARQYPEVAAALAADPDFPEGRLWRKAVASLVAVPAEGLQGLGWPSSPWFLAPGCRRSACLLCLSEAPLVMAQYVHEVWLQSWRTTCPMHQVPLVEVPGVGASWALLSRQSRRLHGALMRRPDHEAVRLIGGWGWCRPIFGKLFSVQKSRSWKHGVSISPTSAAGRRCQGPCWFGATCSPFVHLLGLRRPHRRSQPTPCPG